MTSTPPVLSTALQQLLYIAAEKFYNCISIDGDTSTNDMVAILANGAAGGERHH
jgi:glutamate N-acetyltransferase / amino-acid N-acetyltransferase